MSSCSPLIAHYFHNSSFQPLPPLLSLQKEKLSEWIPLHANPSKFGGHVYFPTAKRLSVSLVKANIQSKVDENHRDGLINPANFTDKETEF